MLDALLPVPNANIRKQATFLAADAKFELGEDDHTAKKYGELLCFLVNAGVAEKNLPFQTVSGFLCNAVYKIRETGVLKRMAINALAIIHLRGDHVGDVEQNIEVRQGWLAKIKNGQPLDLTPTQIINLASLLSVPIGLFFEDFDDNPAGLRLAMEAIPSPDAEDHDEEDTADRVTEDLALPPESSSPFVVALAPVQPEPPGEAVQATVEEAPVSDTSPQPPDPTATIVVSGLLPKASPDTIARNVRAAAKRGEVTLTELQAVAGIENRSHLVNIEKGSGAFTVNELAKMADRLGVEVSVFYSGEGLDRFRKRPKVGPGSSLVVVGAKKLLLPPISEENRQEFFRGRCLRRGLEIAEGGDISNILAAAGSKEPVDWNTLWRTDTKEGVVYQALCDSILKKTQPMGDLVKADFLSLLHAGMFPALEG